MVARRTDTIKRKRKEMCNSPLLDDSPKRTKVHAQRKFAQGSNVNSPVITPVKELESERSPITVLPEPVELLPIKRPNTEDFLTFLCFRGTPILPPSLNFFNTASIVDTNGQVHEIKSESPKNGPIDIAKCAGSSSSSDKPFIAFGVRKRADPIVISRQMDRKRRHALALQALRRKYQEQKMAKIRALTISKLSEKVTNKTLVRTNSVSKSETVLKKTTQNTIQKTKVKVVATKHVKVTTHTLKTSLRAKMQPKMCLRSFRGRFVQRELPFRKDAKMQKNIASKRAGESKNNKSSSKDKSDSEYSTVDEDEEEEKSKKPDKGVKENKAKNLVKKAPPKIVKIISTPKTSESSSRVTRSGHLINTKLTSARRQQIKKRILLSSPKAIVKPRLLRSTTLKKTQLLSQKNNFKTLTRSTKESKANLKLTKSVVENQEGSPPNLRKSIDLKKQLNKSVEIKKEINVKKVGDKKEINENKNVKKEVTKLVDSAKKVNISSEKNKKEATVKIIKNEENKLKSIKKINVKSPKIVSKSTGKHQLDNKKVIVQSKVKEEANLRSRKEKQVKIEKKTKVDEKAENKNKKIQPKAAEKTILNKVEEKAKTIMDKSKTNKNTPNESKVEVKKEEEKTKKVAKKEVKKNLPNKGPEEKDTPIKKETMTKKEVLVKKETTPVTKKESPMKVETKKESPVKKELPPKKEVIDEVPEAVERKKPQKRSLGSAKIKPDALYENLLAKDAPARSSRPSRKTKEAAAIYMELLSQKLVHERLDDEDNISIDSFPELPNVKRTEQRENELKAQAKSEIKTKSDAVPAKVEDNKKNDKKKVDVKNTPEEKVAEVVQIEIDNITIKEIKVIKPNDAENEQKDKRIHIKRKSDDFGLLKEDSKKPKVVAKTIEQKPKETSENVKKLQTQLTEDSSKKKTRLSSNQNKKVCNESDSDDSINLSKIKKQARSKSQESQQKIVNESKETKAKEQVTKDKSSNAKEQTSKPKSSKAKEPVKEEKCKDDKSDVESIASSDINLKDLKDSTLKSKERNFSDSDEEPLSKLTTKSGEGENSQKSIDAKRTKTRLSNKRLKLDIVPNESPCKPKRECAKRPQNYLMFSSSESEDEYFYGFESKPEKKAAKMEVTEKVASDLLSKDISRRFGKEKVNMSNEQIEKWLKDSAMAGNSGIKADDELLKFGESIPTETTLDTSEAIDTQKLKKSLLTEEINLLKGKSTSTADDSKSKKQSPLDRKPIFRKTKKESPNVNAFSPENESSVYAFGEENEDVISTPFRRPSRRPSSTATSRSEDEQASKEDKNKPPQFRLPPTKKEEDNEAEKCFVPPNAAQKKKEVKSKVKNVDGKADNLSEDFKYKVPSSPSASSSSSAKLYKRQSKGRSFEQTVPVFTQDFPHKSSPSQLVEGPVFRPTDQEFQDPLEYIERIRKSAEQFGICKIIPPPTFKPECKIIDDMRFTAYNQYVHKMLHRWGPNFKELMAIKKYLETQNISLSHPPWIGGMEIDLPRLYQTVQTLGGLKEVIEKKKWPRVSECMKIPKSAQDRVTKLDDIYCKYLLPYDTLSPTEREKLFEKVETDWAKRESKGLLKAQQSNYDLDEDSDESETEVEECIMKGRNMALNAFYRIARNTMSMHFKSNEPSADEVEQEFWKHVKQRQNHICVHSGSIDSGNWGYGFAVSKNSPFARHAWNLKVLTNNSGSILRSMGPIMGVTVPTLHVGMVFSACCWYRDPHGLPWIEYLHTGGNKIWYGIPNSASDDFQNAMKKLVPNYCRNKQLWLPSDTAMVPPDLLLENNVSLSRIVQNPGEFIVVFPKCFTSSISTGYVVSESVYFAPPYWLRNARDLFNDLRKSCEPSMFSLERLILSIATDLRSNVEVLKLIIPFVQEICDKEKSLREKLKTFGNMELERLPLPEAPNARKRKKLQGDDGEYECETCRMNLFVSMVFDKNDDVVYCLDHAIEMLELKKLEANNCTLMFTYELSEMDELIPKIYQTIETKTQKKVPNKFAGMPTLLK